MRGRADTRRGIEMIVAAAAIAAVVRPAAAAWSDLLPKPFENGAAVEFFASHERENDRGTGRPFEWTDTFFREELSMFSNGYFYHPRFLLYRLWVAGALKQEDYHASDQAATGWLTGTGVEYDAHVFALPEHPYNFELFALRDEPLYMEQSATHHDSVETANGAQFRFRRKPFFFHVGYLDNGTRSSSQSSDVERWTADGQYYNNYEGGNQLSLNANVNDAHFSGTGGITGDSRDYGVGGFFEAHRARLHASFSQSNSNQDGPLTGRAENDRFAFDEVLSLDLPLSFKVDLAYRIFDNDSKTPTFGTGMVVDRDERTEDEQVTVDQTLYRSLDSRYVFLHRDRTSTSGDSDLISHTLSFDYKKTIPDGRVLAGVNVSRIDSDNHGQSQIVGEPHPGVAVPGSFVLGQPFVQPGTIDVYLPSPVSPFPIVHLVEGTHFTVSALGNSAQVTVFALPPVFVVPGTYDFSVSYALATGTFELLTKSYGFNVSVPFLDNMFTPYADYVAVRSDVLSGTFPGISPDSTTYSLGLSFLDGPWRALGEYESFDWAVSPYKAWRGEVQYIRTFAPDTRLYATGTFLHRYYPDGSSGQSPEPYTDTTATISGNFQKDFLARALTLATGAAYSRMAGLVDGYSYSANASVTWKIGKLDLIGGASAYGSQTQATTFQQYDRAHQFYYLRLRRQISK